MKLLFLFLDGVGLGADDPQINPFARAEMPNLIQLLGGRRMVVLNGDKSIEAARATLVPIDACLGIPGLPQSASGQATLLTGKNIPQQIGEHYGPKPNPAIRAILEESNLFHRIVQHGRTAILLNAFPDGYFSSIQSGKRLPGAIAMSMRISGIPLLKENDLLERRALSADFTGEGWQRHLGRTHTPIFTPAEAGYQMAKLADDFDLAFFEGWPSDFLGHRRNMENAVTWVEQFDAVLGGLLDAWDDAQGLILLTSDHGNLEDLSTRRHTTNPVPALLIGAPAFRLPFAQSLIDLSSVAPAIERFLEI